MLKGQWEGQGPSSGDYWIGSRIQESFPQVNLILIYLNPLESHILNTLGEKKIAYMFRVLHTLRPRIWIILGRCKWTATVGERDFCPRETGDAESSRIPLTSSLRFLLLLFSLYFLQFPPELLLLLPGSLLGRLQLEPLLSLLLLLPLPFFLSSLLPQAEKTQMVRETAEKTGISLWDRQCPGGRFADYKPQGASHSEETGFPKRTPINGQKQEHSGPGTRSLALCSGVGNSSSQSFIFHSHEIDFKTLASQGCFED